MVMTPYSLVNMSGASCAFHAAVKPCTAPAMSQPHCAPHLKDTPCLRVFEPDDVVHPIVDVIITSR